MTEKGSHWRKSTGSKLSWRATPPEGIRGVGLWNVNRRLRNTYGELSGLQFSTNDWGGLSVLMLIDFSAEKGETYATTDRG